MWVFLNCSRGSSPGVPAQPLSDDSQAAPRAELMGTTVVGAQLFLTWGLGQLLFWK